MGRGGKRDTKNRKPRSKNVFNRELLHCIDDNERMEYIRDVFEFSKEFKNVPLTIHFIEQFVGRAPNVQTEDSNVTVNIFDLMKGKT